MDSEGGAVQPADGYRTISLQDQLARELAKELLFVPFSPSPDDAAGVASAPRTGTLRSGPAAAARGLIGQSTGEGAASAAAPPAVPYRKLVSRLLVVQRFRLFHQLVETRLVKVLERSLHVAIQSDGFKRLQGQAVSGSQEARTLWPCRPAHPAARYPSAPGSGGGKVRCWRAQATGDLARKGKGVSGWLLAIAGACMIGGVLFFTRRSSFLTA